MKNLKRFIAVAVFYVCASVSAWAQSAGADWSPSKPVRIVVPITGSTNDVLARLVAPKLQEALGQPVVVENKPGAGGNIGANEVVRSAPDGHTLLVGYNGPLAINVTLFEKMPYDPLKDLAPITLAVKAPQYLVVNPATGITSVKDLVAKAKAAPSQYSYGSVALGSASHLTMEMLKSAAGFHMTHIPYRGAGPAVTDLIAGNIQAGFFVPGNVQQFVKEGRLHLLATSGSKRFGSTPDIPTLVESGYKDFEATSWIGFLAPGGTPAPIIERYNREIVKILNQPDIRKRLIEMEFDIVASSPKQFSDWIRTEIGRWGKVIKDTGAKAE
ncbi:tripartite tricarboxylate transporter substrate binding protein [Curvibacter fontanus]|jgi:tripartite-type tricarboxylate transporter receptor subunit TctC|uniref:Bug family tripartite tricarboxylate transporter substrate binding protein n=1 Tax=Rhodoferax sp. BAB1 TaxID=2741720 RepID=UPI00157543E4|nr:tripartite tricarboxylate transporter substrate binding protein [Rhodoferax sp. BAB1]QKO22503.1 tripartite tricarboxylate transporter substrate binding protein [Rhodoferax sp. BAB1]